MAQRRATPIYPLYNTTFQLHRLNIDLPLHSETLRQYAQRFRDILAGEVLRGVRVNLAPESSALAGVGSLQSVTWRILLEEEAWSAEDRTQLENEDETVMLAASRGTIVTVTYEQAIYTALLLRNDRGNVDGSVMTMREDLAGPQRFPLMMTRMAPPLRDAFITFLTGTFDVRISPLHLSSGFIVDTFENYISEVSIGDGDETMGFSERSRTLKATVREVLITIGFDIPGGQLKSIDISIAKEDVPNMIVQGERLGREEAGRSPFFDALAKYVKKHMAMDLSHERVKIQKISCKAFTIGAGEGKIKIPQPTGADDGENSQSRAMRRLIHGLITAAAHGPLTGEDRRT